MREHKFVTLARAQTHIYLCAHKYAPSRVRTGTQAHGHRHDQHSRNSLKRLHSDFDADNSHSRSCHCNSNSINQGSLKHAVCTLPLLY